MSLFLSPLPELADLEVPESLPELAELLFDPSPFDEVSADPFDPEAAPSWPALSLPAPTVLEPLRLSVR